MATAGSNTTVDETNTCSASLEMKKGQTTAGGGKSGKEKGGTNKSKK